MKLPSAPQKQKKINDKNEVSRLINVSRAVQIQFLSLGASHEPRPSIMSCSAGDTQPTPRKRVYGLKLPTPISSGQKRKLPGLRQEMNADFAAGDSGRPRSKRLGKRRRDESDIAPNVMRSIDCNGRTKKARTAGKSKREAAVQLDVKMNEPAIAKGTQRKAKKATKVKIAAQKKIVKHSAQTGDKSDANKAPVADICPVRATGRRDDSIYSQMLTTLTQKTDGIDNKIEQVYRNYEKDC